MQKIIREGYTITIELPEGYGYKGYSVKCTYKYSKAKEKYRLSMWLKRNDIDDDYRIENQKIDTQYIPGTKENIEGNISKIVEQAASTGYFDQYIERFEYGLKCFERGNRSYEDERIPSPVKKDKIAYRTVYYCSNCGDGIEEENEFCPHCRVLLDWDNVYADEDEDQDDGWED